MIRTQPPAGSKGRVRESFMPAEDGDGKVKATPPMTLYENIK